tara:strand:- start:14 stop:877 length:864 start_codon:yes stop_codon:yes gene_type:complete
MNTKNKGLGRGLSALFGDQKANKNVENTDKLLEQRKAPIDELNRNKYQPRVKFDQDKINELAESIKKNGVIQPIAVRNDKSGNGKYEIIAGERRWIAAQKAGLHEVPIVILDLNDNETLEVAIVENIQREDLNPIEEANGYKRLHDEFNYDQEKIANFMGKSRSHVSNTIRLLALPQDIISMIEEGLITAGQARPLIGLGNASTIAEEIVSKKLSAREIEMIAKGKKVPLKLKISIDPNILSEQKRIEDSLGLKVKIVNRKDNSGQITVEYKNVNQFNLISTLLRKD